MGKPSCVWTVPLGFPVVPEVYMIMIGSSASALSTWSPPVLRTSESGV